MEAPPEIMRALLGELEFQVHTGEMKDHPGAKEAHPGAVKTPWSCKAHPGAKKAKHGSTEAHLEAMNDQPGVVEACAKPWKLNLVPWRLTIVL
jgi:hypothetical protein